MSQISQQYFFTLDERCAVDTPLTLRDRIPFNLLTTSKDFNGLILLHITEEIGLLMLASNVFCDEMIPMFGSGFILFSLKLAILLNESLAFSELHKLSNVFIDDGSN